MQDTITEFETVEKEREVTEVITDYETEEQTIEILRCDNCEKNLGDIDDPGPHAKVAVNPSIASGSVTNYRDLVDALEEATLDAVTKVQLRDKHPVHVCGWDITPRRKPSAADIADYGYGRMPHTFDGAKAQFRMTEVERRSFKRTEPKKLDKLFVVNDDDITSNIRRINFAEFIKVPDPEIDCDVSLDLCESCATGIGATVDHGNAALNEREKSTETESHSTPQSGISIPSILLVVIFSAVIGGYVAMINPWALAAGLLILYAIGLWFEHRR